MNKIAEATNPNDVNVDRLGEYKATGDPNKGGVKINIPKDMIAIWNLQGGEDLHCYLSEQDGKIVMIISRDPFSFDRVAQAKAKIKKDDG